MNQDDLHFFREQVFAYLRGELDGHDTARFERIMLNDSRAADFVSRLNDMLRSARVAQPEAWVTRSADEEFVAILHDARQSSSGSAALRAETSLFLHDEIQQIDGQNINSFASVANSADVENADALFSAIAEEIRTTTPLPAYVLTGTASNDTQHTDEEAAAVAPRQRSLVPVFFAVAAVMLLTFVLVYRLQTPTESAPQQPVPGADNANTTFAAPAISSVANRFADLATTAQGTDDIRVYELPGAEWELVEGPENRLDLRQGAIFVEYIREDGESLTVHTDTFDLRVVGTVFYVSAESAESEVGVLTGTVEVEMAGQETGIRVQGGEQFDTETGTTTLHPETREQLMQRVDPAEHEVRLQQATVAMQNAAVPNGAAVQRPVDQISALPAPGVERNLIRENARPSSAPEEVAASIRPESPMAAEEPDAGPRTTADILAAGRSAERNSEWRLAAESYEQALRVMPRDATDAAAVRLDLARIYLRRLQSPELGMQQLRTFLQTWPQDPAAASVREELCRLAAARNLTESLCD